MFKSSVDILFLFTSINASIFFCCSNEIAFKLSIPVGSNSVAVTVLSLPFSYVPPDTSFKISFIPLDFIGGVTTISSITSGSFPTVSTLDFLSKCGGINFLGGPCIFARLIGIAVIP